ncbi:uncharacterized protein EAE97_005817 [Botrytis byssoidea]|uniref:DUF7918 domain-containing protein n=1 Tax=Botrytis byssoidea TaxID=139641 RepID=A0A9P5LUT3_9HELO|nr:uncharacterized protein EAE97_005817 [Botrytis byssoidea]KAF7943747.1 hypothetical protein EAE97_005817 [Botrytis byssoidea]
MEILEDLRGIEVTMCVDKQALQEYIESTTGKVFYIKIEMSKAYKFDSPDVSFEVSVGGTMTNLPFGTKEVKGVKNVLDNGRIFLMPFKFSDIITSTDDSKLASIKEDATRLSVVREIVVKVYRRGERTRAINQSKRPDAFQKLAADSSASVHEKALKGHAKSHSTTLGAPQATKAKCLKSLLILERTPEPSPSPSPAPISDGASGSFHLESLDATQKAKLQEFLGNLLGNGSQFNGERKIKREREETGSDFKASKRSKRNERVEVDLTGDDSD